MNAPELEVIRKSQIVNISEDALTAEDVFYLNDEMIGTLKSLSLTQGKEKSRKTFNVTAIAAAALSKDKILGYSVRLPEKQSKLLYVDTEQSKQACINVKKRILKLAGLPIDDNCSDLIMVSMLGTPLKITWDVLEAHLASCEGLGFVIIDGVRDLLSDFNDVQRAYELVIKLQEWAHIYNVHIHCVLHQNKGKENSARGHLGAELTNKSETVLQVELCSNGKSKVSWEKGRGKIARGFSFSVNEEGLPIMETNI